MVHIIPVDPDIKKIRATQHSQQRTIVHAEQIQRVWLLVLITAIILLIRNLEQLLVHRITKVITQTVAITERQDVVTTITVTINSKIIQEHLLKTTAFRLVVLAPTAIANQVEMVITEAEAIMVAILADLIITAHLHEAVEVMLLREVQVQAQVHHQEVLAVVADLHHQVVAEVVLLAVVAEEDKTYQIDV